MNWRDILDPPSREPESCTQNPQNPQKSRFSAPRGISADSADSAYRSSPPLDLSKTRHDVQRLTAAAPEPEARAPLPTPRPAQRAYHVLLRMAPNEPARWVTMVTTDADTKSAFLSADRQFGGQRVLAVETVRP